LSWPGICGGYDLVIAATATVHGVPLLTHNVQDFAIIDDLTDARLPQ
jgi:predicted nucleic acid-binding protein